MSQADAETLLRAGLGARPELAEDLIALLDEDCRDVEASEARLASCEQRLVAARSAEQKRQIRDSFARIRTPLLSQASMDRAVDCFIRLHGEDVAADVLAEKATRFSMDVADGAGSDAREAWARGCLEWGDKATRSSVAGTLYAAGLRVDPTHPGLLAARGRLRASTRRSQLKLIAAAAAVPILIAGGVLAYQRMTTTDLIVTIPPGGENMSLRLASATAGGGVRALSWDGKGAYRGAVKHGTYRVHASRPGFASWDTTLSLLSGKTRITAPVLESLAGHWGFLHEGRNITWQGWARGERESYFVRLRLEDLQGLERGTIEFPGLRCSGWLKSVVTSHGGDVDLENELVYAFSNVRGPCIPGWIRLRRLDAGRLEYAFLRTGGQHVFATGELHPLRDDHAIESAQGAQPVQSTPDAVARQESERPSESRAPAAAAPEEPWTVSQYVVPASRREKVTTKRLEAGVAYTIQVSGTFDPWGHHQHAVDALECFDEVRCRGKKAKFVQELRINGAGLYKMTNGTLAYNSSHVYEVGVMGTGEPLELHVFDAFDRASSGDNSGEFKVVISRLP